MNIRTTYASWRPDGHEWAAVIDDLEDDSPCGYGSSELMALEDLAWQVDTKPELEALVEARIAQHKASS